MNAGILAPGYAPPVMPRPLLGRPQPLPMPYGRGGDPYWGNVSAYLTLDGLHGSRTITDSSRSGRAVTRYGNAAVTGQTGRFGQSVFLSAAADYLTLPASSDFAPGAGDYTIEGWFNQTQTTSYGGILWAQTASGINYVVVFAGTNTITSLPQLDFISNTTGAGSRITHPTTYALNQWHHFAVTRQSGVVRVFLNGFGTSGTANTQNLTNTTYAPTIGRYSHANANNYIGYVSHIRYTIGVARYTSSFAPLTAPFPIGYQ